MSWLSIPKTKKRSRIGYRIEDKKTVRFAKKSGEALVSGKKLKKLVEEEAGKEKKETPNQSLRSGSGQAKDSPDTQS